MYRRPFLKEFSTKEDGCSCSGTIHCNAAARNSPVFSLRYAQHYPKLLAMADEDGCVSIVNTSERQALPMELLDENSTQRPSAQWFAHKNAIFDLSWSNQDRWMYTASGDTTISLWDTAYATRLFTFSKHEGSVKSISVSQNIPEVFASGARDGCLCVWDARIPPCNGRHPVAPWINNSVPHVHPVVSVSSPHARRKNNTALSPGDRRGRRRATLLGKSPEAVTAVQFLGDGIGSGHVIASGGIDGSIQIWDIRRMDRSVCKLPKNRTPLGEHPELDPHSHTLVSANANRLAVSNCPHLGERDYAVTSLSLRPDKSGQLLASFMGGHHLLYDTTRPEIGPVKWFGGHSVASFYVKSSFSPDGSHILSGSSDSKVYLWQVDGPADMHGTTQPYILEGHEAEVTTVAWCPNDFSQIATAADDYTVKVWNIQRQQEVEERGLPPKKKYLASIKMMQNTREAEDKMISLPDTKYPSPENRFRVRSVKEKEQICRTVENVKDDEDDRILSPSTSSNKPVRTPATLLLPAAAAQQIAKTASSAYGKRNMCQNRMRVSNALRTEFFRDRQAARRHKQQTLEEALQAASNKEGSCTITSTRLQAKGMKRERNTCRIDDGLFKCRRKQNIESQSSENSSLMMENTQPNLH